MIRTWLKWLLTATLLITFLNAQRGPDLAVASDGKKVYVFLITPLPPGESVDLWRSANGRNWEKVNAQPVAPLDDPYQLPDVLEEDYSFLVKTLRTSDAAQILLKLKREPVYATLLSFQMPALAIQLGRMIVDDTVLPGQKYQYKVSFIKQTGEERKQTLPFSVTVQPPRIREVSDLKVEVNNRLADIEFTYPKFTWARPDHIAGFNIYRSGDNGQSWKKVNSRYLYRQDNQTVFFQDGLLPYSKTFLYRVKALTFFGYESPGCAPVKITVVDKEAPGIVQQVEARAEISGVVVSWKISPESDVAGYKIYRGKTAAKVDKKLNRQLVPALTTVFIDSSATDGVQWFYGITAVDRSGNESKLSARPYAVRPDKTPPPAPGRVTAVYQNKILQIRWQSVPGKEIRGYYVYRGSRQQEMPRLNHKPLPPRTVTYADSGYGANKFEPGETYWVAVRSVDQSWNLSAYSYAKINIPDDEPPLPPTGILTDIRQNGDVHLSWNPSPSADVIKYRILVKAPDRNSYQTVVSVGKDTLKWVFPSQEKGKEYGYKIVSEDKGGNVSVRGAEKILLVRDVTPPPSPRNVFLKKTAQGYRLTWNKVVDFDMLGYRIYRANSSQGKYQLAVENNIASEQYQFPLTTEKGYYQVRAVDTSGNESVGNEIVLIK